MIVDSAGGVEPVETSAVQRHLAARDVRLADEGARIAAVKARGVVPDCCGPEIPEAPARGAFMTFEPHGLYPDGEDGWVSKPAGFAGRKAMMNADAFDKMEAQARKVLFSPGQKQMGRFYATLVEKLDAVGARCSSLEAMQGSGGGGGEYIDAVLRDRARLDLLHRRIGQGVAMEVRRVRPSKRNRRGLILNRALVDAVCVQGRTIAEVLEIHGWKEVGKSASSQHIKALRAALCETLNRMMGPVRSGLRVQGSPDIAAAMQDWVHGTVEN